MFHVKFSASVARSAALVHLISLNVPTKGEKANPDRLCKKKKIKQHKSVHQKKKKKRKRCSLNLNFCLPSPKLFVIYDFSPLKKKNV